MTALEHMVRNFARTIIQDGVTVLITNGQPALVSAFHELGWSDPYPDPTRLPPKAVTPVVSRSGTATVTSPERAVIAPPKGRLDGGV